MVCVRLSSRVIVFGKVEEGQGLRLDLKLELRVMQLELPFVSPTVDPWFPAG